jgi:hypothetical protein
MKTFKDFLTERKPMDMAARKKKARTMARLMRSSRMQKKIAKAKKKHATPDKLWARAQKAAKMMIIKKAGIDDYKTMPPMRRMEVDKKLAKKLSKIDAYAKKLVRSLKSKESERIAKAKAVAKEQ